MTPILSMPLNWYWMAETNTSQFWSSAAGAYVTALPPGVVVGGLGVTVVPTEQNIAKVMTQFGLPSPVPWVPDQVQMWALKAILQQQSLLAAANTAVTNTNNVAIQNAWQYSPIATRNSPAINSIATTIGLTSAQVDQIFISANALYV